MGSSALARRSTLFSCTQGGIYSATMAVKKHELAPDSRNQLDLATLAQYIQMLDNQPFYLPDTPDITKHCQDIVKCLGVAVAAYGVEDMMIMMVEVFLKEEF
ncbi:unnamed protein product [Plutella xylostella]|uniref:(diamondback moth) hypothetical protein n=1 Tax=Plutella xylostella TaxID=51655 RepID=A0A8S4GEN1_PLUXY|nr:unnamed protein product [Plutella xylostella]